MRRLALYAGGAAAVVVVLLRPSTAGADPTAVVTWACGKDVADQGMSQAEAQQKVESFLLEHCGGLSKVPAGQTKEVCGPGPLPCDDTKINDYTLNCGTGGGNFSANGGDSGFGWAAHGTITITATTTASVEGKKCELTRKSPQPEGDKAEFVRIRGTATIKVSIKAKGTGHVELFGFWNIWEEQINQSCSNEMSLEVYKMDSTPECKWRPTCVQDATRNCCVDVETGVCVSPLCDPAMGVCSDVEEPCPEPNDPACQEGVIHTHDDPSLEPR